jgi:hypothetical protein
MNGQENLEGKLLRKKKPDFSVAKLSLPTLPIRPSFFGWLDRISI